MSPSENPDVVRIPAGLLPADGRFGCGPSRIRPEAVDALAAAAPGYLGTSHRQPAVRNVVASLRAGLAGLFSLPEGWEVLLGNGGTTVFWDVATFGLIERRSQHLTFGEFSSKFAAAAAGGTVPRRARRHRGALRVASRAPGGRRRRPLRAAPTTRPRPAWR